VLPRSRSAAVRTSPGPFDSPVYIFELKHDGYRALAFGERDKVQLVSRRGHVFKKYDQLCAMLAKCVETAASGPNNPLTAGQGLRADSACAMCTPMRGWSRRAKTA